MLFLSLVLRILWKQNLSKYLFSFQTNYDAIFKVKKSFFSFEQYFDSFNYFLYTILTLTKKSVMSYVKLCNKDTTLLFPQTKCAL